MSNNNPNLNHLAVKNAHKLSNHLHVAGEGAGLGLGHLPELHGGLAVRRDDDLVAGVEDPVNLDRQHVVSGVQEVLFVFLQVGHPDLAVGLQQGRNVVPRLALALSEDHRHRGVLKALLHVRGVESLGLLVGGEEVLASGRDADGEVLPLSALAGELCVDVDEVVVVVADLEVGEVLAEVGVLDEEDTIVDVLDALDAVLLALRDLVPGGVVVSPLALPLVVAPRVADLQQTDLAALHVHFIGAQQTVGVAVVKAELCLSGVF